MKKIVCMKKGDDKKGGQDEGRNKVKEQYNRKSAENDR